MVVPKVKSVFLIDDDNITNYINARLLRRMGVSDNLSISSNGLEAIQFLEDNLVKGKECPSLILLDINMPVMDGFEFMQHFLQMPLANRDEAVVYILTTSENTNDMERMKSISGIAGLINKPLTEEKIIKILNKHFN